jgi:hypothetical protein
MAFLTLNSSQLLHTISSHTAEPTRGSGNRMVPLSVGLGFAIQLFGTVFPPLRALLGLSRLGVAETALSMFNAGLSFALIQWQTSAAGGSVARGRTRQLPAGSSSGGSLQAA